MRAASCTGNDSAANLGVSVRGSTAPPADVSGHHGRHCGSRAMDREPLVGRLQRASQRSGRGSHSASARPIA
eukprot:scaffold34506_cov72-Phaeocystis_antarctica.AAC.4